MTAEHFTLQSGRGNTIAETNGRVLMPLLPAIQLDRPAACASPSPRPTTRADSAVLGQILWLRR